jgi:filamentous hemagglutinin
VLNRFCSKKLYDDPLTTEMIVNVFIGLGSIGLSLLKAAKAGGSLATPKVTDPDLENLVDDLYKGAKGPNSIGTGSTADAVRNELQTGLPTHGRFHSQKAQEYSTALNKWLKKNPNASDYDKMVARSILNDLQSALEGD